MNKRVTYRPGELEGQFDSVSIRECGILRLIAEVDTILTENGRGEIAVGARTAEIDAGLIVFQTDTELGAARFTALVGGGGAESATAVAFDVAAERVVEAVDAQFKDARPAGHTAAAQHQHKQNQKRFHFVRFRVDGNWTKWKQTAEMWARIQDKMDN